jgi:hypothetical protein
MMDLLECGVVNVRQNIACVNSGGLRQCAIIQCLLHEELTVIVQHWISLIACMHVTPMCSLAIRIPSLIPLTQNTAEYGFRMHFHYLRTRSIF